LRHGIGITIIAVNVFDLTLM